MRSSFLVTAALALVALGGYFWGKKDCRIEQAEKIKNEVIEKNIKRQTIERKIRKMADVDIIDAMRDSGWLRD